MSDSPVDYERKDGWEGPCMRATFGLVSGIACFGGALLVPMIRVAASWQDVRNRHVLLVNAAAVFVGFLGLVIGIGGVHRIWRYSPFMFITSLALCCGGICMGWITFVDADLLPMW